MVILLTPRTWRFLRKVFKLSRWIHLHPFVWNEDRKCPELVKSATGRLLWYLSAVTTLSYFSFVITRVVQTAYDEEAEIALKVYMLFSVAYFALPAGLQLHLLMRREALEGYVQNTLQFLQECEDEDILNGKLRWSKRTGTMLALLYYSCYVSGLLVVPGSFFRPHSPELLSSLLPGPAALLWYERVPFVLLHLYVMLGYIETGLMYIFFMYSFFFLTMDILEGFRARLQPERAATELEDRIELYEQIQRQMGEFNSSVGIVMAGGKLFLIFMAVFCTYGGIRFNGLPAKVLTLIGITCTSFLIILINSLGEYNHKSQKLIRTWSRWALDISIRDEGQQQKQEAQWLCAKASSLRSLNVRIGSLYYIDKPAVVTCFQIVFDNVMNFLLTF